MGVKKSFDAGMLAMHACQQTRGSHQKRDLGFTMIFSCSLAMASVDLGDRLAQARNITPERAAGLSYVGAAQVNMQAQ